MRFNLVQRKAMVKIASDIVVNNLHFNVLQVENLVNAWAIKNTLKTGPRTCGKNDFERRHFLHKLVQHQEDNERIVLIAFVQRVNNNSNRSGT